MPRFEEDAVMHYNPADETEVDSSALRIKQKHEARLLDIDGVEGVGLGADEIGEDAIVIYLRDADTRHQMPAEIEGVPVIIEVTGRIDAY